MLATVVAIFGYFSVAYTLGFSLKEQPAYAHNYASGDGRVTARLAQAFLTENPSAAGRDRASQLAWLALKQDPTAVRAVITLGLSAQLKGNTNPARRLFVYAQALSRRELQTQLWAIEDAVARDDISDALQQYDIALRTSPRAQDLLFPMLASAIADPPIRSALIGTLSAKPAWGASFVDYVVGNGPGAGANASFFQGLRQAGVPVTDEANAMTINALLASGLFHDAWGYYAQLRPGADRHMSRDPEFTSKLAYPAPFDWAPVNDGTLTTSIQRDGEKGVFEFAVPASVGGPLLRQIQMLSPGRYRLEGHSIGIDLPGGSYPYWVLSCGDGHELGRIDMRDSAESNGTFSGVFSVPAGCPIQTLSLVARSSNSISEVTGQIDRVQLFPVR